MLNDLITHFFAQTGYGNPSKVAMKRVTSDAEISMVYEEARIAEKPNITQVVAGSGVTMEFKADMSNGDYASFGTPLAVSSDFNAADVFVNRLVCGR